MEGTLFPGPPAMCRQGALLCQHWFPVPAGRCPLHPLPWHGAAPRSLCQGRCGALPGALYTQGWLGWHNRGLAFQSSDPLHYLDKWLLHQQVSVLILIAS